jgi:hypothetical protein
MTVITTGIAKKIAIVVVIGRNFNAKKLKVVPPSKANARQACNFGLFDENCLKPPRGTKIKNNIKNAPQYLAKIT